MSRLATRGWKLKVKDKKLEVGLGREGEVDMCETRQPPNADPVHSVRPSIHPLNHSFFPFSFSKWVTTRWVCSHRTCLPLLTSGRVGGKCGTGTYDVWVCACLTHTLTPPSLRKPPHPHPPPFLAIYLTPRLFILALSSIMVSPTSSSSLFVLADL